MYSQEPIERPRDLGALFERQSRELAEEIRQFLVHARSRTGGGRMGERERRSTPRSSGGVGAARTGEGSMA